jgi:hypothetical protein
MTNRKNSKPTSMMLNPHETAPLRAGKEVQHGPL